MTVKEYNLETKLNSFITKSELISIILDNTTNSDYTSIKEMVLALEDTLKTFISLLEYMLEHICFTSNKIIQ